MDAKHTPGPWHCGPYHHVVLPEIDLQESQGGGMGICHVYGDDNRADNARLIAAAPDLLAAAQAAADLLTRQKWRADGMDPESVVLGQCLAAIANATGAPS